MTGQQRLPASGPARESLREKGQFWTPDWIADGMVAYPLRHGATGVFDPAVGAGAFFRAARRIGRELGRPAALAGIERHESGLQEARRSGLSEDDLRNVVVGDFLTAPIAEKFDAIVANPPYIRHHRISLEEKARLKERSARLLGFPLDGRCGYHVHFLLHALAALAPDGCLAFILPADTFEGVSAPGLWSWILGHFRMDAVVTFAPACSPFPGVDTNPVIVYVRNAAPRQTIHWVRCEDAGTSALKDWVMSGFSETPTGWTVIDRDPEEARRTGLSRDPVTTLSAGVPLGQLATVKRGIATGANRFFVLTAQQATSLGISDKYLVRVVGRTRDVPGEEVTDEQLRRLETAHTPTYLLSLGNEPLETLPDAVQRYIDFGAQLGLPDRPLISTRRPWYRMEVRPAPDFLFAYLGRRNVRFIRNRAGVKPLTGFLCVYPNQNDRLYLDKLSRAINHPETLKNLALVGKSYGGGALKVEPRALERLSVPFEALAAAGLEPVLKTIKDVFRDVLF